jgi:hypothetical protein
MPQESKKEIHMSLASASSKEIELLSKSAAFAMSLGAKELFHTNFLAFLLESDDLSLEPVQLAIRHALKFPPSAGALTRCAVWREKNNLDLVVVELRSALAEPNEQEGPARGEQGTTGQSEEETRSWNWTPEDQWHASNRTPTERANPAGTESPSCDVPTDRVLIIEAKLKSLPRLEQLSDYDDRLDKSTIKLAYPEDAAIPEWEILIGGKSKTPIERRLLSVTGISMTTPEVRAQTAKGIRLRAAAGWQGVSWRDLYGAMNGEIATLVGSSMQQALTDYIQVLGALVRLLDRVHQMCDDAHAKVCGNPTYEAFRMQVLDPRLRSLRIHDLLGKTLFDRWLTKWVCKPVATTLPEGWSLNRYVNYSRGVPGIGVELVNEKFKMPNDDTVALRIGVQVQSCEFRLFVDVPKGWSGLETWIATHELLMREWLGLEVFEKTPVGTGGLPITLTDVVKRRKKNAGRATNLKVFDANRFLYSKVDIDDQCIIEVERELARVFVIASGLVPKL